MKPWIKQIGLMAFAATALTFASCGDDDSNPINPVNTAPDVNFRNPGGSDFSGMINIDANSSALVTVVATDAEANLNTIEFLRNGTKILASSGFVRIDDDNNPSTAAINIAANPLLIVDNKGAYTQTFTFSGSTEFATTTTYSVVVTDAAGLSTQESFTITTNSQPVNRDTVMTVMGKFFNRDGPNFGSFDLIAGDSIASSNNNPKSRLQDAGNGTDSNWDREILGEGDAKIVTLSSADLATFNSAAFDAIRFTEDIRALISRGTVPAMGNGRTRTLNSGDSFLVLTDDRVYVVRATRVVNTGSDNLDFYEIDYKFGSRN